MTNTSSFQLLYHGSMFVACLHHLKGMVHVYNHIIADIFLSYSIPLFSAFVHLSHAYFQWKSHRSTVTSGNTASSATTLEQGARIDSVPLVCPPIGQNTA